MKRVTTYLTVIMAVLLLVACGGGDTTAPEGTEGADQQTEADDTETETEAEEAIAYPEEPITLIVPFGAGGALDATARALGEAAQETGFPVQIQVVNRPGAGGTIATAELVETEADGYTIALLGPAQPLIAPQMRELSYGLDDIKPIMMVMSWPFVLAVPDGSDFQTAEDLFAFAENNPGQLNMGVSGGEGNLPHLVTAAVEQAAGVEWQSTFFPDGAAEGIPALLGGHVDAYVGVGGNVGPHVESGDVRTLITLASERSDLFPDTPTASETGLEGVSLQPYVYLVGPAGMPDDRVDRLNELLRPAFETDTLDNFAEGRGFTVSYVGPDELTQRLQQDYEVYGSVIEDLGLAEE